MPQHFLTEKKNVGVKVKRKHPESELQIACVTWARIQYPILNRFLFAIPNGGSRSKVEAAIMKGEGVTPDVPDLFLSIPSEDGAHGFYIEMKAPGQKARPGQREWLDQARLLGYEEAVCDNFDDFRVLVTGYMQRTAYRRVMV